MPPRRSSSKVPFVTNQGYDREKTILLGAAVDEHLSEMHVALAEFVENNDIKVGDVDFYYLVNTLDIPRDVAVQLESDMEYMTDMDDGPTRRASAEDADRRGHPAPAKKKKAGSRGR